MLLDILRAKEGVLANAVISRTVAAKASAINQTEVEKYISANPLKFANRQLMAIDQITFPIGASAQAILDATKDKKSLDEVDQQLTVMNVPHGRSMGSISSGDIPENLFNQMQAKKPDDVFFLRVGSNGLFLVVKSEQARPLNGDAAYSFAGQALRADLLKTEL